MAHRPSTSRHPPFGPATQHHRQAHGHGVGRGAGQIIDGVGKTVPERFGAIVGVVHRPIGIDAVDGAISGS